MTTYKSPTGRWTNQEPRPQYLPPSTPEARAVRAALQDAQASLYRGLESMDLTAAEKRIEKFAIPPRHPATNIGE